jgi:hypothetical protein
MGGGVEGVGRLMGSLDNFHAWNHMTEPTNYQNYVIDVDGSGMRETKVLTSVTEDR